MSDINSITSKIDTDNQKGVISEKEFNDNFGKFDQTDYKKISEGLEAKDQQFLNLLQKPIFENIQRKNLLNKQSLSINEIKIVKLFFMSYSTNANISSEREKSNNQKMAEIYMNQQNIFYGLGQEGWNEFKKGFKGSNLNFKNNIGKSITYQDGPIDINHPDIKRLNKELLPVNQQIEKNISDRKKTITNSQQMIKSMDKYIEYQERKTRPLSKKLEELKNKNTLDVLDELTSVPYGILYDDNIKEITENEKQKIQKIIENVFSNPSVNSTQVMDYVWKIYGSLSDNKRSSKPFEGTNQVNIRVEIINNCYQLAQAKGFGELQSNPETAKNNLLQLCRILTGRFSKTKIQEDSNKKFNNPELARGILESLMQINGTIDKISPMDILKDELDLKNKECGSFVSEISQNIPRPLSGEFGILDLVSIDEKTKISELSPILQARAIVLKKISEKIKSDKKQVPFESKYIQELKNLGTNEAKTQQTKFETQKNRFKEGITGTNGNGIGTGNLINSLKQTNSTIMGIDAIVSGIQKGNNYKSTEEFGLQGVDKNILALYRDFAVNNFWAGQLSDEVEEQVKGYIKMGAMIGGTIVTMMIFPPAGVGHLGSAIAVGATSTILTQALYQKMEYESFTEGAVDIGSQFVFDTATAFLGMKVFGPIIQKVPGFLNQAKTMAGNFGLTIFDASIGAGVEGVRQIGVNKLFDRQEDVDIMQMIKTGGVMATVFLMASGGFHAKLPVDDMLKHLKANDPKTNPTGFKNLKISKIDYQNSIKLLELKSNALKNKINNNNLENKTNKQIYFDYKFNIKNILPPIKDGKYEYHVFDMHGNKITMNTNAEAGSIEHKIVHEIFKKSIIEDVAILGKEYVLKTAYGYSIDFKLPGDLDYAITARGMIDFLYKLKQNPSKIKNFEITGNVKQKEKIGGINKIEDIFDSNGVIKEEIKNMIINGMQNNQKVRISYDSELDINIDGKQMKGSINREMFVEDGTKAFEVDPKKSMTIKIDGVYVKMLSPKGFIKYSEELFLNDFKNDIFDGTSKFKIAKRIGDYIDTLKNIENQKNIFQKILDYIKIPFTKGLINNKNKYTLLEGLEEAINKKIKTNANDPIIEGLKEVLEFSKKVIKEHEGLVSGREKLPENIGDFTTKTNKVRENVLAYKTFKEIKDNPELLTRIKDNPELLTKYMENPYFIDYAKEKTNINENDLTNSDDAVLQEDKIKNKIEQIKTLKETKLDILGDNKKFDEFLQKLENNHERSIEELNSFDYTGEDGISYYFDYYIITKTDKYNMSTTL